MTRSNRHTDAVALYLYGHSAPPQDMTNQEVSRLVGIPSGQADDLTAIAEQLANDFGRSRAYWLSRLGGSAS